MPEKKYNKIEQKIMRLLYQTKAPLSAYEVAKETGISFPTAKKYLEQLTKQGILLEVDSDGKEKKT